MLQKRQQVQMERLQKDNHFEKTNEIKTLTQDHSNNPWFVQVAVRLIFVFFYTCKIPLTNTSFTLIFI